MLHEQLSPQEIFTVFFATSLFKVLQFSCGSLFHISGAIIRMTEKLRGIQISAREAGPLTTSPPKKKSKNKTTERPTETIAYCFNTCTY